MLHPAILNDAMKVNMHVGLMFLALLVVPHKQQAADVRL